MDNLEYTISDIKDLMNAFSKSNLGSMELSDGSFTLKLEAKTQLTAESPAFAQTAAPDINAGNTPAAQADTIAGTVVKSPIVGTFYAAPAPDKAPFVSIGDRVEKGDVLFIIESMKLMNEVTAETDGTVRRILVQNAQGVEYGQPIMEMEA